MSTIMKFASGVKPERGGEFLVDLADIAADHASNNRFNQSDVKTLIQSISQYGQLEAVGAVRVKPENTLRLAYGFGRYEAIKRINEHLPEDQQMRIKVVVFDGNERDVFFRNLAENAHRNELTHMDYAVAIRRMSESYGQSDSQIANFFNRSPIWVSQHRTLLSLDHKIQDKVQCGEITMTDALAIAKLPSEKQKEVVREVVKAVGTEEEATVVPDGGTEEGGEVITGVSAGDGEAKPAEPSKPAKKRKIKEAIRKAVGNKNKRAWPELHSFFEVMIGSPAITDELQNLANVMIAIMDGVIDSDGDAVEALEAVVGGKQ